MAARKARFADYLDLLKAFNHSGTEALIVGGQAVNLWAEIFQSEEPELSRFQPFTSSDLDLLRPNLPAREVLRALAQYTEHQRDPFGKAFTIVSHTFLIRGAGGNVLPVHDLKMVVGLGPADLRKHALHVEFAGVRVHVLNPIACLMAKLHNIIAIDQRDRQDEKHVRILIPCVRGFLRRLIMEAAQSDNYRPVLDALKHVLACTSKRRVLSVAQLHGFDLSRTLPVAELKSNPHPKLARFAAMQLPRWERLLRK